MQQSSDKPIVKWLEVVVSPRWQEEGVAAAVHPVYLGERQPCFGVTLNERWLCSSSGAPTLFDSMAAATRFMGLMNVERLSAGERQDCEASGPDRFQCFRLGNQGLVVCNECRERDVVRKSVGAMACFDASAIASNVLRGCQPPPGREEGARYA